jgi:hypothetical protein
MDQSRRTTTPDLQLDPWLKDIASRAAADEQRSLTSLIEKLLTEYLRERGYLAREKGLRPSELTSENVD